MKARDADRESRQARRTKELEAQVRDLRKQVAEKDEVIKVVGYAFSDRIDTKLTLAALDMAVRRQKPKSGLIFTLTGVCNTHHLHTARVTFMITLSRKTSSASNASVSTSNIFLHVILFLATLRPFTIPSYLALV